MIVEIVDYLEENPQVLQLTGYFDCKLIMFSVLALILVMAVHSVFFFEAAMNVVSCMDIDCSIRVLSTTKYLRGKTFVVRIKTGILLRSRYNKCLIKLFGVKHLWLSKHRENCKSFPPRMFCHHACIYGIA